MESQSTLNSEIAGLPVPLERDKFMRCLIRELSGLLEEVVGLEEASGFISMVGQQIGNQIHKDYLSALGKETLNHEEIGAVLVDMKRRINGDFYIIEATPEKIVLGNRRCPFSDKVKDRSSLCMMTSNVFGVIAAENAGYAKVSLEKTIARRDKECRVVVYLRTSEQAAVAAGREYYKTE
jgi:predicted ArsR family transcriptional regulator